MGGYVLEMADGGKPRRGRPSAEYRGILLDFLGRSESRGTVTLEGRNAKATYEGLRAAKRVAALFADIDIKMVGGGVELTKPEDYWARQREAAEG